MSYVITLVAPSQAPFLEAGQYLEKAGISALSRRIFKSGRAIDIETDSSLSKTLMDDIRDRFQIDILWQDKAARKKRLFIADMDATMVEEETLDELAAHFGIKDQIAAITARAMNGELDFAAALRERVGLLKGLPQTALEETAANMHFTKGGQDLLNALKKAGVYCVLVSGGFTFFTEKVAKTLGFDENHGNKLHFNGDVLTGTVNFPILDKNFKKQCLEETAARLGIAPDETVAIGDGANDLPMLETAGLGVGFNSKKILREALPNHILFNGLDALIYGLDLPQIS